MLQIVIIIIFEKENIIRNGNFGVVFSAGNKNTNDVYSMRIHKNNNKNLVKEVKLLKIIKGIHNAPNIIEDININNKKIIIEILMGPSIEKLYWF